MQIKKGGLIFFTFQSVIILAIMTVVAGVVATDYREQFPYSLI